VGFIAPNGWSTLDSAIQFFFFILWELAFQTTPQAWGLGSCHSHLTGQKEHFWSMRYDNLIDWKVFLLVSEVVWQPDWKEILLVDEVVIPHWPEGTLLSEVVIPHWPEGVPSGQWGTKTSLTGRKSFQSIRFILAGQVGVTTPKPPHVWRVAAVGRYATGPCSVSVAAPFFFFFV
jgi:hypothetical protein